MNGDGILHNIRFDQICKCVFVTINLQSFERIVKYIQWRFLSNNLVARWESSSISHLILSVISKEWNNKEKHNKYYI